MALMQCPDCGKQISEAAPACPHCGRPRDQDGTPVTTQLTAKSLKAAQAIGAILIALSLLGLMTNSNHAYILLAFILGVALYIGARLAAWWYHG